MRLVRTASVALLVVALLIAVALAAMPPARAQTGEPVDLMLVLSSDVSRSIDHPKFMLQREGYAAAVADPQVLDAIRSGPHGKIAISFVEWSGFGAQKVVIDWSTIDDTASARRFGDQLAEIPRSFADRTSISGGIEFAAQQFDACALSRPHASTIDVSGDGTNNAGRDVRLARDEVLAKGITINGLVILSDRQMPWNAEHTNPPGGLEKYYRDNVIGGPGSFVMVAEDFQSFGRAIIKKMIAEIATWQVAPRVILR